jgi:hypothetical protein
MAACAKCGFKLEAGLTRCPSCDADLTRPGGFTEVVGWVSSVLSSIPLIIGAKTVEQKEYVPLAIGAGVLILGLVMIIAGRSRGRGCEKTVVDDEPRGGSPAPSA